MPKIKSLKPQLQHMQPKRKSTAVAQAANASAVEAVQNRVHEKYTNEELQEYREVFSLFDKDRSGSIGYAEMEEAMHSLGLKPSKQEISELIKEVDVDGNGEIDFEEFCLVMEKMTKKKDSEQEIIRQCFEVFDRDGDGVVHEKEFRKVCAEFGDISERVADEVFNEADVAGNGRLDYDEFAQMAKNYLFADGEDGGSLF